MSVELLARLSRRVLNGILYLCFVPEIKLFLMRFVATHNILKIHVVKYANLILKCFAKKKNTIMLNCIRAVNYSPTSIRSTCNYFLRTTKFLTAMSSFPFSTVVTIYAIESDLPEQKENQDKEKVFIDKDILMDRLRTDFEGKTLILLIIHSAINAPK